VRARRTGAVGGWRAVFRSPPPALPRHLSAGRAACEDVTVQPRGPRPEVWRRGSAAGWARAGSGARDRRVAILSRSRTGAHAAARSLAKWEATRFDPPHPPLDRPPAGGSHARRRWRYSPVAGSTMSPPRHRSPYDIRTGWSIHEQPRMGWSTREQTDRSYGNFLSAIGLQGMHTRTAETLRGLSRN